MFLGIEADPQGLPRRAFNKHLDALLTTGEINPEHLEDMNQRQQEIINEIKKALIRLKNYEDAN